MIKLSENIHFTGVCVKRPTVKRRQRMMVIRGTLITLKVINWVPFVTENLNRYFSLTGKRPGTYQNEI